MAKIKDTKKKNEELESRERTRKFQLGILSDPVLKALFAASQITTSEYGIAGRDIARGIRTIALNIALGRISLDDGAVYNSPLFGRVCANALHEGEALGDDSSISAIRLQNYAERITTEAIGSITVEDILKMSGISEVHESQIPKHERLKLISEYAGSGGTYAKELVEAYTASLTDAYLAEGVELRGKIKRETLISKLAEDRRSITKFPSIEREIEKRITN